MAALNDAVADRGAWLDTRLSNRQLVLVLDTLLETGGATKAIMELARSLWKTRLD